MSSRRVKYLLGGVIIFLAIGSLIYFGATRYTGLYLNPSEVVARGETLSGETVRINGKVVTGSVSWKPKIPELIFKITDGKRTIAVVYNDIPPDTFKEKADVVVGGVYRSGGIFKAETLLAKCPSKYEAKKSQKTDGAVD